MDEPSLTVLTSPSQKQTERCHPIEARPFTVRENARCQSFPDEWNFCRSVGVQTGGKCCPGQFGIRGCKKNI